MDNISIYKDNILSAKTEVIVNAANPKMLGGGGVDGAIHQAAGPQLLEACQRVKGKNGIRCPVGESRITIAGNLSAKYVIHTVGPRYHYDDNPKQTLSSCYSSALHLAIENQCTSIAFPAISCGAYGFPIDEAADIAIKTCSQAAFSHITIDFYLYGNDTYSHWGKALNNRFNDSR